MDKTEFFGFCEHRKGWKIIGVKISPLQREITPRLLSETQGRKCTWIEPIEKHVGRLRSNDFSREKSKGSINYESTLLRSFLLPA
jgi:hypothetical protein